MVYFTADTHFGHANIIKSCGRPFADVEEMNEAMIAAWNERVTENDTVYIVGDMFFLCKDVESILNRLRGKKSLILGNHDGEWKKKVDLPKYFVSVDKYLEISDGQHALTFYHYPLLDWQHKKNAYMIHGHIHANTNDDYFPLLLTRDRVLNAGVDINGFRPVTFDELVKNNMAHKQKFKEESSC